MTDCAGRTRFVPADHEIVRAARGLGIGFGDEDESQLTPEALD
jgi:hypothetical protein